MEQVDDSQRRGEISAPTCYEVQGGEPWPALDRITRLAAHIFETPIAAVFFREDGDVRCPSAIGLDGMLHPENTGLFAHAIEHGEPLIIEDASADERFDHDPLVTSPPYIRFFASVPLIASNSQQIGALTIADSVPRPRLSEKDLATFAAVADLAADMTGGPRRTALSRDSGSAVLVAMSHDLRTPMNGVLGMAELLLATDDLDERHRRRIDIIKRSGTTLLSMIDQIVEVAKLDADEAAPTADPFDLKELLQQATSDKAGEALKLDFVDHLGKYRRFLGDAARVRKLLSWFLTCASRFAAEGTIRIVASTDVAATGGLQIRIRAEHAGIDCGTIERLLTSFSTPGDPNAEHLDEAGLGLILCRKLAMAMRGTIGIDRPSGGNPALLLDLSMPPDSEAITANPASQDLVTSAPEARQAPEARIARHVLVAEDNPDMAMLIEDLLDEAGYHATIAYDGASALKVLSEQHFDIVLMDGRMPDMSGFETTASIRRLPDERADVPIVALTGEALAGDRERYLSAGMNDYITKPVDYETLIDTIERCCSQRQVDKSSDRDPAQQA